MEYSRHALYALGEPFGDSATRKEAGRIIYGGGGGGQPKSTTQITELPAWARGYAKDILAKGAALTNINTNPYVQYGGQRVSDFSPLQQQSFEGAANLQYNPVGQQYTGENVGQYMNPYLQNALAPQLREAASAGMMAQNMDAAKAVGQGAFGGTRGALQQSLTQKNVLQNMSDINARGYSDAFNQAAGMFNTDQARRIQEAQFGAGYGMDVNKLQNTYGQQQQAQQQRGIDVAYQNFLDEKNYPYKQLGFMSDLIKNPAIGSRSQTQIYEPAPNMLSTVAGLGVGAAALAKAKGGMVGYAGGGIAGYADGGMPGDVTSPENISEILSKLSDEQLQQVMQMRPELAQEIQMEMKRRADVRGAQATPPMEQGLASLPTGPMPQMAGGGIVAFAGGRLVEDEDPLFLTELLKTGRIPEKTAANLNKYLEKKKEEAAPRAPEANTVGSLLGRGISNIGADISSAAETGAEAVKRGVSSILPSRQQYGAREAAWLASQPQFSEEALRNYPIPKGGPRGSAGSPMADEATEAARAAQAEQPAAAAERTAPAPRASGLAGAASAFKLPDFDRPQSISDIENEMAPFMAKRRAENAELLKPEQAAVDALHASIAESKKGDVKQQLLGIAAGFLSSKSPYFAQGAGDALTNYMNISKEQKKFNADAVKEATAAQTALARYKVALDKGDEATAAKFKEIADNKADKAIGYQLQGLQLAIAAKQADTQAAYYVATTDIARQRLKILQDGVDRDVKIGQENTKLQKQVMDELNKPGSPYTMEQDPIKKQIMFNDLLRSRMAANSLLSPYAGNVGLSNTAGTDNILKLDQ